MRAECVTAITNAAAAMGRKLTQADLRGIEDRIRGNKKALQQQDSAAYLAMSPAERIKKAGEMAAEQTLHEAIKKRQQADRQVQVRSKIMDYLGAATAKGMTGAEALQHYLFKNSDGKGGVQSVESWIKAVSTDYKSQLDVMLKYFSDNETLGIFASKEGNMEFIKAARGKSTNPKAIEAYNAFKKMNDAMIDQFNRLGGNLDKRADWGTPQKLNAYRLLQMTEAKFIDEWINFVDRTKYAKDDGTLLNDAEMRSFLKEAYATMVTGGGQKKPGEGTGSLANRRQTHRQLHYTADGYAKAMDMAGAGSVLEQIHSHIDGLAKDIALVEMMGPNAERTYQEMRAYVVDTSPKTPKTESLLKNMDTAFDQVYGIDRSDLSVSARHTLNELKSWQIVAKLGSMLLAQIGDITTIKTTADAMNIPMSAILSNAAKYATSPEYRSTSRSMGFAMESLAHSVARFGDESSSYGMASKGAALLVKMQGATAWNNMWRAAFGNAMAAQTSQMNTKFKAMKDLPDYDRRVLESKGVTEQDWKLWQMAQRDGYGMIGAKSIADVDVQQISKIIPEKIAEIHQQGADLMARYDALNQKELGWLNGREQKFADYKTKLESLLSDMEKVRETRAADLSSRQLQMAGELQMRLEQAEVDFEIFTNATQERASTRTDKFMDEVKRGMEWYGRRRSEIGEQLGAKRHSTKLSAAANDKAVATIEATLRDKAEQLFGAEKVEEGLISIGKVTRAAKEFEAYRAKMEDRITKYSGKKGGDSTVARSQRLLEQATQEYQAIKQKADAALTELEGKVTGDKMELAALREAIDGKRAQAEAEADIAGYLQTEKSLDKVQNFFDTLEFRGNQAADRMGSAGERLGYRKAIVEARMREFKKRESAYGKTATKEVFGKAAEFEKRIDKRMSELDEFRKGIDTRMAERQKIVDEYNNSIGKRIDQAAYDFRRESSIKLMSMLLEETHMAVLDPSAGSRAAVTNVVGSGYMTLMAQFKQFPVAYFREHFIQRAQFAAEMGRSPMAYRAKLIGLSTVFGGVSLVLGDIASGRDPRDITLENDPAFALKAMFRGGGFGIFNDLLEVMIDPNMSKEKAVAKLATGPAFTAAGGILAAIPDAGAAGIAAARGDEAEYEKRRKEFSKGMYQTVKENTPFQNFWPTKALVHNIILHDLQELANPGYMERAKEAAEKRYKAGFWLTPDETRAPDFGNIFGQGEQQ